MVIAEEPALKQALLSDTYSTLQRKSVVALGNPLVQTMLPSPGRTHLVVFSLMEIFPINKTPVWLKFHPRPLPQIS